MSNLKLYKIECSYCHTIYNYRLYKGHKLIQEGKNYIVGQDSELETIVSYGICNPCTDKVYQQLGIKNDKKE